MRIIRYFIVNKNTGKAVDTDCRKTNLENRLAQMADKDNYIISYKWMSI